MMMAVKITSRLNGMGSSSIVRMTRSCKSFTLEWPLKFLLYCCPIFSPT